MHSGRSVGWCLAGLTAWAGVLGILGIVPPARGETLGGVEIVPLGGNCRDCGRWIPAGQRCDCWIRAAERQTTVVAPVFDREAAARAEARAEELAREVRRLKLLEEQRRREEMAQRGQTLVTKINRVAGDAAELRTRIDGMLVALGRLRTLVDEQMQLGEMLDEEHGEARATAAAWTDFQQAVEQKVKTGTALTDGRCAEFFARLSDRPEQRQRPGPAAYLPPPPYLAPDHPQAASLFDGTGRPPAGDRWFAGATQADLRWREERDRRLRPVPVAVISRLQAAEPLPRSPDERDLGRLERVLHDELTGLRQLSAASDSARATKEAAEHELTKLRGLNETTREKIKALRGLAHVAQVRVGEEVTDYARARLQEHALELARPWIEKSERGRRWWELASRTTAEADEMLARYAGLIGALQQGKEFGQSMHQRVGPGGSLEQLFTGIRSVIRSEFDPAEVARFEAWLARDCREFADGLQAQTPAQLGWWLTDLRNRFPREE